MSTLNTLGLDSKKFGVYSLRSGVVTAAPASGVNDRLFKKHGQWKSDVAKNGYVHGNLKVNPLFPNILVYNSFFICRNCTLESACVPTHCAYLFYNFLCSVKCNELEHKCNY